MCHKKQSLRNKRCTCSADLDQLKKTNKVRYWLDFRDDEGKKKRIPQGFSLTKAKAADGKVKGKKAEGTILEITDEAKTTFNELASWYLKRPDVKRLKSYERIEDALDNFNEVFGRRHINTVKPSDLVSYQEKRSKDGRSNSTIDMELSIAKTMINRAFDDDKVSGKTLKVFRAPRKKLTRGSNARDRLLTIEEYLKLLNVAPPHLKSILIIAMNTGMRKGEILGLRRSQIGKDGFIRIDQELTKEKRKKSIPINANVKKVLDDMPRAIHHDFVFTFRGEPIAMGLRKSLMATCKAAGIKYGMSIRDGFRFHDIRTTVKTNMLRAGVDKALRDIILGHSLQGMDAYYIKPTDEDLAAAMNKYTTWLDHETEKIKVDHPVDQTSSSVE